MHGAALDVPNGETWCGDVRLRTAYQHAVLRGRDDLIQTLEELGTSTDVDLDDLAVAAVVRRRAPVRAASGPARPRPAGSARPRGDPGRTAGARRGAARGAVRGRGRRRAVGNLLHHACWVGDAELVGRLLDLGADPVAASGAEFDTPLAWAFLDSRSWRAPGRDFVRVAELLAARGAELEPRFEEVAEGPLAEWLEDRL